MNNQEQQVINDFKKLSISKWLGNLLCKINRKTIIDIIVLLIPVMLIYIYFSGTGKPKEIKEASNENKKIEIKIDSLRYDNEFIKQKMYELEKKDTMFYNMMVQNNDLIKENNKELVKIKKIYNDKINNVNGYNLNQLDSFFTKRYQNYYNR